MKITKFKATKQKKKEMTCKNCIFLEVNKGYTQIYVNDDKRWKKNVESISFFCKKKEKFVRRATRYRGCPDKQTMRLTDYATG